MVSHTSFSPRFSVTVEAASYISPPLCIHPTVPPPASSSRSFAEQ